MRKSTKYLSVLAVSASLLTSGCGLFKDDKHPATTSTVKSVPAPTGSKGSTNKHNLTLTPKSGDLKGVTRKENTPRCSPGYDTLSLIMGSEVGYGKMSFIASMKGALFVIDYYGGTAAKVVAVIINDEMVFGVVPGEGDPGNTSGSFILGVKALKGATVSSAVLCINVDA